MPRLNPFTPTFGKVPPVAAGREDVLADMSYAFDNGPGDPNLSTILVGPRGMGKTALLSLIRSEGLAHGWISASVSAVPGMLEDILLRARESASELVDNPGRFRVKEFGIPQVVNFQLADAESEHVNWRTKMNHLLDELRKYDTGLVITVDEVTVELDEMIQLVSVYQHFVTEDRKVALVMAGLPYNVTTLLEDGRISFLRRARQRKLGRIPDAEIENALKVTVENAGKTIEEEALKRAVEEIDGFPFMMQLVGYRSWAACNSDEITVDDVARGIRQARAELVDGVIVATYSELSDNDLRFCQAMLADTGASRLSDVARRMGVKSNYASSYKKRLLMAGVIEEQGSLLRFAIPGFRTYLAEQG